MESERGVALIMALLVLTFLTILGGALLATSTIDIWISDNYKTAIQGLYLTEAGIDHAREHLRTTARTTAQLLTAAAGADGTLSTATNLNALLASDDQPLVPSDHALRAIGQPLVDGSGRLLGRYHVWLRNDIADGIALRADTNQVLTLISFGRIGSTRKTIEVIVKKGEFPAIPAALTVSGPADLFDRTGATITIESEASLSNDDGMDPRLKTVSGLESIIASITANATDVFNPAEGGVCAIGNYGGPGDYPVAVVNGDVHLGPGTGYGLLVARGNVTVAGNFSWSGLIVIVGQGVLHWNAGNNGVINGGVFMARTRGNDRSPAHPVGTPLAALGGITADFNRADGSIHYVASAIAAANQAFPYVPISIRER